MSEIIRPWSCIGWGLRASWHAWQTWDMLHDERWSKLTVCGAPEPISSSSGVFLFFVFCFCINIIFIEIFVCLDGKQPSVKEKDYLVYQLCCEVSSLPSNCAASALFPHEWAMSEFSAFNFCSKFDGCQRSQPAVKHNCLKNLITRWHGQSIMTPQDIQEKGGLLGYRRSKGETHMLRLTGFSDMCTGPN